MATGFGAYGKIPAIGDFLRMGLGAGFIQPWDDWLQRGLLALREAYGGQWDACYLSAPIWRFSLPAGHSGDAAMLGILMASVDRVGRQYPITLATPVPAGSVPALHFANTALFERLEDIALALLDEETDRAGLAAALEPLTVAAAGQGAQHGAVYRGTVAPAQGLAAASLPSAQALWSAALEGDHRLMCCPALPQGPQLAALFDLEAPVWQHDAGVSTV